MLNYFGKYLNPDGFVIKPIIIEKEGSPVKLALYGMGYMKEIQLNEMFADDKIHFEKPPGPK